MRKRGILLAAAVLRTANGCGRYEEVSVEPLLEAQTDYSNDALYQTLAGYVEQKGCKNGYVMWPVRTAVSGKQMTPAGATEIMEVLGKEESLARIRRGIEKLQNV